MLIEAQDEHIADHAADADIVRFAASKGWIVITKDKAISGRPRRTENRLTIDAVGRSGARLLVCVGSLKHPVLAQNVVRARHKLDQFCHKHRRCHGFIARFIMLREDELQRTRKAGVIQMWRLWPKPGCTGTVTT